jgi:hypothetical protein
VPLYVRGMARREPRRLMDGALLVPRPTTGGSPDDDGNANAGPVLLAKTRLATSSPQRLSAEKRVTRESNTFAGGISRVGDEMVRTPSAKDAAIPFEATVTLPKPRSGLRYRRKGVEDATRQPDNAVSHSPITSRASGNVHREKLDTPPQPARTRERSWLREHNPHMTHTLK